MEIIILIKKKKYRKKNKPNKNHLLIDNIYIYSSTNSQNYDSSFLGTETEVQKCSFRMD